MKSTCVIIIITRQWVGQKRNMAQNAPTIKLRKYTFIMLMLERSLPLELIYLLTDQCTPILSPSARRIRTSRRRRGWPGCRRPGSRSTWYCPPTPPPYSRPGSQQAPCQGRLQKVIKNKKLLWILNCLTVWQIIRNNLMSWRSFYDFRVNKKKVWLAAFWPILVIFFSIPHGYQYYWKFYYFWNFLLF